MRPDRVAVLAEVSSSTLRNRYTTKRDLAGAAYAAKLHEVNDTATYYRRDEAYRSEALLGEFVHALSHLFADTPALAIALLDTSHQKPSAICTRLFNETVGVFGLLIEDACPTHYPEFLVAQYHLNALLAMSTSDTSVNPDTLAEITLSQLM
jgi:hypothetical protein